MSRGRVPKYDSVVARVRPMHVRVGSQFLLATRVDTDECLRVIHLSSFGMLESFDYVVVPIETSFEILPEPLITAIDRVQMC